MTIVTCYIFQYIDKPHIRIGIYFIYKTYRRITKVKQKLCFILTISNVYIYIYEIQRDRLLLKFGAGEIIP